MIEEQIKQANILVYCQFIKEYAHKTYSKELCGKCAYAVRRAVEFALKVKLKRVLSAKNYGPSYEAVGFKKVFNYPLDSKANYLPQIGDIAIIKYKPHGHITIFTDDGWVSDYFQLDMYGGIIRKKDPPFQIYRLS